MEMITLVITILLSVAIASGIVYLTASNLIKSFLDKESERGNVYLNAEIKKKKQETILPLQLQAYERLVLFLERITPNNAVMRIHLPGMSGRLLHSELLKSIREEYEHNLAQQIYLSAEAWKICKDSKDETVKILNIALGQLDDTATGLDYSKKLFEILGELDELPTEIAGNYLRYEVQKLF